MNDKLKPENFVYWLQGFFEMTDAESLTPKQVLMIKEHLKLVFTKETHQNTFNESWARLTTQPSFFPKEDELIYCSDKNIIKIDPQNILTKTKTFVSC